MDYDYTRRGYLLPEGCKDLIDVLKLKARKGLLELTPMATSASPTPLPAILGGMMVAEHLTVSELATLLNVKPFAIVADLMEMGTFASLNHVMDFDAIAKVARKHGYSAKRISW